MCNVPKVGLKAEEGKVQHSLSNLHARAVAVVMCASPCQHARVGEPGVRRLREGLCR